MNEKNSVMELFMATLLGLMLGGLVFFAASKTFEPELRIEEFYRFCLEKHIELSECKIPARAQLKQP